MPRSGPVRCFGERSVSMRANVPHGPSRPRGARGRRRGCCARLRARARTLPSDRTCRRRPRARRAPDGRPGRRRGGTQFAGGWLRRARSRRTAASSAASPRGVAAVAGPSTDCSIIGASGMGRLSPTTSDPTRLLLQPIVALGLLRRAASAGHRAPAPRRARAEALRLPGRGAAHRRRPAPHAPRAAPHLSRTRARPLAQISRHAAATRAAPLPEGRPAARLEQAGGLDGDRRPGGRRRRAATLACAAARALGGGVRHRESRRAASPSRSRTASTATRCCSRRRASRCNRSIAGTARKPKRSGVFGAPTFVLNGERFWGQDRLDFVDRALDALRASA